MNLEDEAAVAKAVFIQSETQLIDGASDDEAEEDIQSEKAQAQTEEKVVAQDQQVCLPMNFEIIDFPCMHFFS